MALAENPGRERILARVREALTVPSAPHAASGEPKNIFAAIDDPLGRFQNECVGNRTECLIVADRKAGSAAVAEILASLPRGQIFVQDCSELREMAAAWSQVEDFRWSSAGPPAETSAATITTAELLVAATGSVLVSAECGGRGASVVAPVHVVVARIDQLVPDLESAFSLLHERGAISRNSFLCLITGSSRTADIEKILVMGAHGPRRLIVVLSLQAE